MTFLNCGLKEAGMLTLATSRSGQTINALSRDATAGIHARNMLETELGEIPKRMRMSLFSNDRRSLRNTIRDDYRELLCLAALIVGLPVKFAIRKPGALHRARWMAKAIYSLKIELL
jgi:hypothetical protein